jgi:hypothetical protein
VFNCLSSAKYVCGFWGGVTEVVVGGLSALLLSRVCVCGGGGGLCGEGTCMSACGG